jgi:hypothetical protein
LGIRAACLRQPACAEASAGRGFGRQVRDFARRKGAKRAALRSSGFDGILVLSFCLAFLRGLFELQ